MKTELTKRERQVLLRLCDGWTSAAIAEELGVSRSTISNHREMIRLKLRIPTTAGLIRYAINEGIVS